MRLCGCHRGAGPELTTRKAPGNTSQRQVHGLNFMDKPVISLLPERVGICRLDSGAAIPGEVFSAESFYSVTGTTREMSLICREDFVPAGYPVERGFRILQVEGPLDFSLTGLLVSLLSPLAAAGVAVVTVSTYDTDYILIKEQNLETAISALGAVATVIR